MKNKHMDSESEERNIFSRFSTVTVILTALFITVIAGVIFVMGERAAVSPMLSAIENVNRCIDTDEMILGVIYPSDDTEVTTQDSEPQEITVTAYQSTEPYYEALPSEPTALVTAVVADIEAAQKADNNESLYATEELKSYRAAKALSYKSSLAEELGLDFTVNKKSAVSLTEDELFLAAAVIQFEVMGAGSQLTFFEDVPQKYKEMLGVAECIRNRVNCRYFKPTTVEGIILQESVWNGEIMYQFSPRSVLDTCVPTLEAYRAAVEVLCNGVTVLGENFYYFCATNIEDTFELYNDIVLCHLDDDSILKWQGHLTTFYAGLED